MEEGDAAPEQHHRRSTRSEGELPFLLPPQAQAFSTYPRQPPTQAALPTPTTTAPNPEFLTPPETTQGSSNTLPFPMLCKKQTQKASHGQHTSHSSQKTKTHYSIRALRKKSRVEQEEGFHSRIPQSSRCSPKRTDEKRYLQNS